MKPYRPRHSPPHSQNSTNRLVGECRVKPTDATGPARPCHCCHGNGRIDHHQYGDNPFCTACDGIGYLDIDPDAPCVAKRGGPLRTATYATRYRAGRPLWNPLDHEQEDHTPTQTTEDDDTDTQDHFDYLTD